MAPRRLPIRIAILGDLTIRTAAGAVDLGSAKQRAVLALLVLHAGRVVSTSVLVHSLWGSEPPRSARHLLHTYVARLRQAMEPDAPQRARVNVIGSGADGYQLLAGGGQVDLLRFRRLRDLAAQQSAAGQPARAYRLLGRAVAMWRDPALTDLRRLLRHCDEVEALRREWVEAALEYVTAGVELGDGATVRPLAQRLAKAEPLDERVQARYLMVLDQVGQQTAAIAHYQDIHARLSDELGVEPGPELAGAYRWLLQKSRPPPAPTAGAVSEGAPWRGPGAGLSDLLNRDHDLQLITDHLARHRLLTVAGPPGVGKSQLALHAAALLHDRFRDGVLVLDCAELPAEGALRARLLAMLGQPVDADLATATAHQQLLLVLDNAEHVIDAVASIVDDVLRGCWRVSIIVASREPLGVADETVRRLAPLPVPAPGAARGGWPGELASVKLFVQRARQVDPDFRLRPDNVAQVATICRELDGLPLAVEMTAACLATDDLAAVLPRLHNPLHRIRPLRRGRPAHHQSLWSAMFRSVEFLPEQESWCFRRLGTLPAQFRLAEAVRACQPQRPELDVARVLARLVDKSLLVPQHGPGGTGYRMLRLLHCLAAELAADEPLWRRAYVPPHRHRPQLRPAIRLPLAG